MTTRSRVSRSVVMTTRNRSRSVRPMLVMRSSPSTVSGIDVERIVFDDLLSLFGRNLMASDMIAVGSIPVESQVQ